MDIYFELMQYPVFPANKLMEYYSSIRTARQVLTRLVQSGRVERIRKDLYTCISGETLDPVADRFQIASAITPTSYVTHHTAMEYHGITNQVYYDVYVASVTKFSPVYFQGYTYHYVSSRFADGIIEPVFGGGVKVTDLERTVIDCIKDFEKVGGLEELRDNLTSIQSLKEDLLLKYLNLYDNQFLYQKTGWLLQQENAHLKLSDDFFRICQERIGKSKRYLAKEHDKGLYNATWRLILPNNRNEEDYDATIQ